MTQETIEMLALGILAAERIYQKVLEERHKRQSYLPSVSKKAKLTTLLEELRIDVGADRVLLFRTHNGGKFEDGESIKKISTTQDIHPARLASCAQLFQSVMFESVPHFIVKLSTNGSVEYKEGKDNKPEDVVIQNFMTLSGMSSFYTMSIVKKGKMIGGIAVAINNPDKCLSTHDKAMIAERMKHIKAMI